VEHLVVGEDHVLAAEGGEAAIPAGALAQRLPGRVVPVPVDLDDQVAFLVHEIDSDRAPLSVLVDGLCRRSWQPCPIDDAEELTLELTVRAARRATVQHPVEQSDASLAPSAISGQPALERPHVDLAVADRAVDRSLEVFADA